MQDLWGRRHQHKTSAPLLCESEGGVLDSSSRLLGLVGCADHAPRLSFFLLVAVVVRRLLACDLALSLKKSRTKYALALLVGFIPCALSHANTHQ